jgi:gliding motility-associated-like protein
MMNSLSQSSFKKRKSIRRVFLPPIIEKVALCLVLSGGTGAYSYAWAPSGGTAATATGLSAGSYTVTVTDANNCPLTKAVTITQPAEATVSSLTRANASPSNEATVSFTVTFNQAVLGLTSSNFALTTTGLSGTSISSVTPVSGSQYTVTVGTGTGTGTLRLDLVQNSGLIPPVAGLPYTAGETYAIDKTAPVVSGVTDNGIYNTDVTVSFDEGTATLNGAPFVSGAVVSAEGTHTLVVTDAAANTATVRFRIDKTRPTGTVSINSGATHTNSAAVALAVTSGDGTGVGVTQMRFSNDNTSWSPWEAVAQTKNWTLASGDGEKTVYLQLKDGAGNVSSTPITAVVRYDSTRPTLTLATPAADPTNAPFTLTVTFSEPVSGFATADITVTNGVASALAKVTDAVYTALITPAADGEVTVSVAADVAADAAANGNAASARLSRLYDATAPNGYTVAFNPTRVDVTNVKAVSVKVTGAEVGTTYFYRITSDRGGTPVTGTAGVTTPASTGSAEFDLSGLDLAGLNDGKLTITFYLQDPAGNQGPEAVAEVIKITRNIVATAQLALIEVPIRTSYEQIPLPAKVEVTYSTGAKEEIGVIWQRGDYNGLVAGPYTLTGELVPASMTTNLDNKTVNAVVEVQPNKMPTALAFSATTFKPEATALDVIGTLTTTDPDDTDFVYELVSGDGATHNGLFEIRGDNVYLKSNKGLSGLTQFSVRVRSTDPYHNTIEKSFTLNKARYSVPEDKLKIVNAFSPNGDGINDTWVIPELRFYNQVEVEVFDRSGVRLFHATNPELGWDGKDHNGQVRQGAYLYIVQVKDLGLVKKGVVTVLKR